MLAWNICHMFAKATIRTFEGFQAFKLNIRNQHNMGCQSVYVPHSACGFWLFTDWKNLVWARLKAWTSHICAWFCLKLRFKGIVWMGFVYSAWGFLLFRWERLNSEIEDYHPLAGHYVNYHNKKKGVISFWGSPFKF